MSQQRFLCVANFDTHLHYKDKNPIWIKLYCSILDDYDFANIADETKFHAVGLMLLASRLNNKFPDDERWLRQKINANSEINVELLLKIGFLKVVKGSRANEKKSFNVCKSNKTKDELSRAVLETSQNPSSPEQKRTEEKRTEENTTEHGETASGVECVEIEDSKFKIQDSKVENQNSKFKIQDSRVENEDSRFKIQDSRGRNQKSNFSIDECFRYVEICKEKGEEVKNAKGLANHLFKTGEADSFILAALFPEKAKEKSAEIEKLRYGEPRQFSDEPCKVCYGAKMANPDGKGFRKCANCLDEKGKATGLNPLSI